MNNNLNGGKRAFAYVDGSFNNKNKVYGYGGFLVNENGDEYILQGSGNDPSLASMRNVAGEIMGSIAAIEKAIELGIMELTLYYDYAGIEKWATGEWQRNKDGTIRYNSFINDAKWALDINFVHVKGHSGVNGNERADMLAKQAVGL